jgi:protein SCO1/2
MSSCVRSRVIVVLCLTLSACAKQAQTERTFELRGQIVAVRPNNEVIVKHDDIKGFMPAMTMPYKVREPELLRNAAAGDLITATLVVGDNDAWLTRIEKTGTAPLPEPERDPTSGVSVAILRSGDPIPDTTLTDDGGRSLSLGDWRGSAVAITFIYTRCPLPQFCPLMDRRFVEVQRLATTDTALAGRVKLLSVSFDPDADTTAVLRAHAAKVGADPSVWRFATLRLAGARSGQAAGRDEFDRFLRAFGVFVIREADKTITHNLRTAVIDPSGRLVSVYDGSDWTPDQIAADMKRVLTQ